MEETQSPQSDDATTKSVEPEKPTIKRRILRVVIRLLVILMIPVFLLAVFQRSLIYVPTKADSISVDAAGLPEGRVHDIQVTSDDGIVRHGWHVLPIGRFALNDRDVKLELKRDVPVMLIFPGNAGNRTYRKEMLELLTSLGVHAILVDYRGYAENDGSPGEKKFARDAEALWKHVNKSLGVPHKRIIILGESLGGGVATRLAAEMCRQKKPPGGLILKATFSSLVDAAGVHYPFLPVSWLLVDRYRSDQQIPDLTCPLLMIHGKRDRIVPMKLGRKLFDLAPEQTASGIEKTFVELPVSGHNDIFISGTRDFETAVRDFLRKIR